MIWLQFIHCTIVSPFILCCFSISLTGERKGEILLKKCRWIVRLIHTYYVTLMAKYMCTWLHHPLKLLPSTCFCHVPIQLNQDGFMLRFLCIFLDGDLPRQLLLESLLGSYSDRLVDVFIMYWFKSWTMKYVTFYTWINRFTCCSTCNLPIQLLLCIKMIVNKCLSASIIKY